MFGDRQRLLSNTTLDHIVIRACISIACGHDMHADIMSITLAGVCFYHVFCTRSSNLAHTGVFEAFSIKILEICSQSLQTPVALQEVSHQEAGWMLIVSERYRLPNGCVAHHEIISNSLDPSGCVFKTCLTMWKYIVFLL